MKGISIVTVALVFLICASSAWAGVTNCNASPGIQADGRPVLNDTVTFNTTNYYFIVVLAGHSYSVEATNNLTAFNNSDLVLGLLTGGCVATTQTFTDTKGVDPNLSLTNGDRISFTAAATASLNISVNNPNTAGTITYNLRMRDTTLYNPRWSTFSGFLTQWAFKNTTSSSITCTLTANDVLGMPSVGSPSITFPIAAGASIFKIIGPAAPGFNPDINVPSQHGGDATLACGNGTPGAIKADAYFIGGGLIVPSTFESRNFQ